VTGEAKSIEAYDLLERVASFDADMEVMHPNRQVMVDVALDFLPWGREAKLTALDLGVGTGFFTRELLARFPAAKVVGIDGAPTMMDLARARLGRSDDRVDFRLGDFREIDQLFEAGETFDLVVSSYALHHLTGQEKESVVRRCVERLIPGGWFANADLIVGASPELEAEYQASRIDGILQRANAHDDRFRNADRVRRFLDDLEEREGDQPRLLLDDLATLKAAGLTAVDALWVEDREAVTVGRAP